MTLTEKDNGSTIQVHIGDIVFITLAWKPSTGYFWQESDTTAGTIEEIKHEGGNMTPGATVYVRFKFKITGAGVLRLSYARPWSETQPPANLFEVSVNLLYN